MKWETYEIGNGIECRVWGEFKELPNPYWLPEGTSKILWTEDYRGSWGMKHFNGNME